MRRPQRPSGQPRIARPRKKYVTGAKVERFALVDLINLNIPSTIGRGWSSTTLKYNHGPLLTFIEPQG
jgi:hypothetical protein